MWLENNRIEIIDIKKDARKGDRSVERTEGNVFESKKDEKDRENTNGPLVTGERNQHLKDISEILMEQQKWAAIFKISKWNLRDDGIKAANRESEISSGRTRKGRKIRCISFSCSKEVLSPSCSCLDLWDAHLSPLLSTDFDRWLSFFFIFVCSQIGKDVDFFIVVDEIPLIQIHSISICIAISICSAI